MMGPSIKGNSSAFLVHFYAFGASLPRDRTLLMHCHGNEHGCRTFIITEYSPLLYAGTMYMKGRNRALLTLTMLAHCVPFPAPGPPRTNITHGLAVAVITRSALLRWRNIDPNRSGVSTPDSIAKYQSNMKMNPSMKVKK